MTLWIKWCIQDCFYLSVDDPLPWIHSATAGGAARRHRAAAATVRPGLQPCRCGRGADQKQSRGSTLSAAVTSSRPKVWGVGAALGLSLGWFGGNIFSLRESGVFTCTHAQRQDAQGKQVQPSCWRRTGLCPKIDILVFFKKRKDSQLR